MSLFTSLRVNQGDRSVPLKVNAALSFPSQVFVHACCNGTALRSVSLHRTSTDSICLFWVMTPFRIDTLKMEDLCSSETLVTDYQTVWNHNIEYHNMELHRYENLFCAY
jgi:hypothetical protein